jgi:hypothetical protein
VDKVPKTFDLSTNTIQENTAELNEILKDIKLGDIVD